MRSKMAIIASTIALVLIGGGGGYALAATASTPTGLQPNGTIAVCVKNTSHVWYARTAAKCATGYKQLTFNQAGKTGPVGPKGATGATGATGAVGAKGATGAVGPVGPVGPKGDPGDPAILTATASTSLSDRTDSGNHGDWATDALVRNATITRQAAVNASKCGGGATVCWFYTGSLTDSGSFVTITDANSPNAGAAINGTVQGTVTGGSKVQFYASSDAPNSSLVAPVQTGNTNTTSGWVKQFFPAGTVVTAPSLLDWSWSYNAPSTCETWVDAFDNADGTGPGAGDIVGVNAC